jgi:hypothetical protein
MWSLVRRYWNDLVSTEGGFALMWIDSLLVIPLVMAAFFYPLDAALVAGGVVLVSLAGYEGWVVWRRRHPHDGHV